MNEIAQIISTGGFPIAACIGLFYLYDKTIKDLTHTLNKLEIAISELRNDVKEEKNEHEHEQDK